jgi:ubiquinone/menaquinone biosynthesis C-methylase UbiE
VLGDRQDGLNMGYALVNSTGRLLETKSKENQFGLQLYYLMGSKLLEKQSLNGKNLLEVSCGKGVGLNFLQKTLGPNCSVGIDIASNYI